MVGAWCFGCCQAHLGFTCWISFAPVFSCIYCWVLIFALSPFYILILLYLLFISWFICSRRWCIDNLGVFMQTQHLCVLIYIWTKGVVGAPLNWFKLSSKIILLTVPRQCFFCGSFMKFLFCFVMLSCTSVCWCLVVTCWERVDLLALVCDV